MSNIENVKPEEPGVTEEHSVRTWQDDLAGQPEVEGDGPFGERILGDKSLVVDTLRTLIK